MTFSVGNVNSSIRYAFVNNENKIDQDSTDLNLSQRSEEPTQTQNTIVPELTFNSVEISNLKCSDPNHYSYNKTLLDDAILADFPYKGDIEKLSKCSGTWELSNKLSAMVSNQLPGKFKILNGSGIKTNSGMVAYLFENKDPNNGEYRLVFGGTTSGEHYGEFLGRNIHNIKMTIEQWMANFKNFFSKVPTSYKDANELLSVLRKTYPNNRFSTSGHSKGAAEASYAALKANATMLADLKSKNETFEAALRHEIKINQQFVHDSKTALTYLDHFKKNNLDKMVKSVNFSSAQLGFAVQKDITKTFLKEDVDFAGDALYIYDKYLLIKNASNLISSNMTHFYIKGDIVPEFWDITRTKHYGNVQVLPNDNPTRLKLSEHVEFAQRIEVMMNNHINRIA